MATYRTQREPTDQHPWLTIPMLLIQTETIPIIHIYTRLKPSFEVRGLHLNTGDLRPISRQSVRASLAGPAIPSTEGARGGSTVTAHSSVIPTISPAPRFSYFAYQGPQEKRRVLGSKTTIYDTAQAYDLFGPIAIHSTTYSTGKRSEDSPALIDNRRWKHERAARRRPQ